MPSPDSITPERAAKITRVLTHRQHNLTVVFENVHDPHNVSAVIRSCDAVGVSDAHGIYYGRQIFPDLGEKSSASAKKWVNVHLHQTVAECYAVLRAQGFTILTTHMASNAVSLYDTDLTKPIALVFGNEKLGVSEEARALADGNILIPQVGMIQSLNISVACAVSLYEAFRQRTNAGMYNNTTLTETELATAQQEWFSK